MKTADRILTLAEALELLQVPKSTFFRWKATGTAPKTFKLPNGSLRIRQSDLDTWFANLEEGVTA